MKLRKEGVVWEGLPSHGLPSHNMEIFEKVRSQVYHFIHFAANFFIENVELFQKGDYLKKKENQKVLQNWQKREISFSKQETKHLCCQCAQCLDHGTCPMETPKISETIRQR